MSRARVRIPKTELLLNPRPKTLDPGPPTLAQDTRLITLFSIAIFTRREKSALRGRSPGSIAAVEEIK